MPKKILIVAVDNNWAIGINNSLIYSVPEDMDFFKTTTLGNIIVYGYNTLLGFPHQKPLKNRTNIVLTHKKITCDGLIVVHSKDELWELLEEKYKDRTIYICGGESIYKQFADLCDEAYVTKIDADTASATSFFPNLDKLPNWKKVQETNKCVSESGLSYMFTRYKRI